jgi:hypothetical protein
VPIDLESATIEVGRQAHLILDQGGEARLVSRETRLVNEMLARFGEGQLSPADALLFVARLAELRSFHADLIHQAKQGDKALAKLATASPAAA